MSDFEQLSKNSSTENTSQTISDIASTVSPQEAMTHSESHLHVIQQKADFSNSVGSLHRMSTKSHSGDLTQLQSIANRYTASGGSTTVQRKENNNGLPDSLKSGIENLSGYSMDDVKVNYNSDKPAQLNAHAYAQGSEIHLGSGQEQHLPHEAWHVVQQKANRVQPNTQVNGVQVNDNPKLETEADQMGAKALQMKASASSLSNRQSGSNTAQLEPMPMTAMPDAGPIVNSNKPKEEESDIKKAANMTGGASMAGSAVSTIGKGIAGVVENPSKKTITGFAESGFIFGAVVNFKNAATTFWNFATGKEDVTLEKGTGLMGNLFDLGSNIAQAVVAFQDKAVDKGLGEVLGPISAGLAAAKAGLAIYNDREALKIADEIIKNSDGDKMISKDQSKILESYRKKLSSKMAKDIVNFAFATAHAISFINPAAAVVVGGLRNAASLFMEGLEYYNKGVERRAAKADARLGKETGNTDDNGELYSLEGLSSGDFDTGIEGFNIQAMVESQMEIREDSQKLIELKNKETIDSKDIADEQEKIELKRNYLYKQIAAYNELFGNEEVPAINEAQIAGLAALYTNTMNAIVKEAKENLATLQWMKSFVSTVGKVEVTNELVKVYGKKDKSELPDEIQFSKLSAQSKNYVWGKTTDALKNTVKARKEGVMSEEQAHENLAKIISENPVAYKDGVLKLMGIDLDELDKTTTKETIKAYLKSNKRT